MRYFSVFPLFVGVLFAGCTRPAEKTSANTIMASTPASTTKTETSGTGSGTAGCPDYFYFYGQEKISLKMKPHFIIAGFQEGVTREQKVAVLRQFPEYENVTTEQTTDVAPFLIVKLRNGTTCDQGVTILKNLAENPQVLYANPVFNAPAALGNGTAWVGLTSEFLVNIKTPAQVAELRALISDTKTKIVEELGETTFLVQATKNSQGNALDMANFFREQPYVSSAEPDFFIAAQTGGLQKK